MAERRVILLGKTGNGKSSTGNSILGDNIFKFKSSSNAVTSQCAVHTIERKDGRVFTVCDTPGLFCEGEDQIEMALKVQKSVEICPEPHVFLLVFSGASRMTNDEKNTIILLRIIFGDNIFDHCIVVITRGKEFGSDLEFEEFWTGNEGMKKIVKKCEHRVVKIENEKECFAKSDIDELMKTIDKLASKGSYDDRYLKTHKDVIEKYKVKHGAIRSEDIDQHLNEIANKLEKKLKEEQQKLEEEKRKTEEERKKLEEENRKNKDEIERQRKEEERKWREKEQRWEEEIRRLREERINNLHISVAERRQNDPLHTLATAAITTAAIALDPVNAGLFIASAMFDTGRRN